LPAGKEYTERGGLFPKVGGAQGVKGFSKAFLVLTREKRVTQRSHRFEGRRNVERMGEGKSVRNSGGK